MHGLERSGKSQTDRQTEQTGKSRGTEGYRHHWGTGKTTTGKIAWNAKQNTRCTRAKKLSAKCRKKGLGSTSAATLQHRHRAVFSFCAPSPPSSAPSLDGSIERGAATGCVWSRLLCDALSNKDKDSDGDGNGGRATQQKLRPTFDPQQEQQQQQGGEGERGGGGEAGWGGAWEQFLMAENKKCLLNFVCVKKGQPGYAGCRMQHASPHHLLHSLPLPPFAHSLATLPASA